MPLDNELANRKLMEMTTDVHPYQGLDDDRMVINGILPEYARPRQRQFWEAYLDDS